MRIIRGSLAVATLGLAIGLGPAIGFEGNRVAQWKLGRMYATGAGVPRRDLRAFEYFSRIANGHADDYPDAPQAPFVANAFVALGQYYLDGIPNSQVKADPNRAREMFSYAASYFGNADAQYHLARIYLDGHGVARDPRQAARWLSLGEGGRAPGTCRGARAGPRSPRTRASTRLRRCSATCCSRATRFRGRPP